MLVPREPLFGNAGHFLHTFGSLIKLNSSAQYQTLLHFCRQNFYWLDTWKVYKDIPRVDMWNTTAAVFVAPLQQGKHYDEANIFYLQSETL